MPRTNYSDEECADIVDWWLAPLSSESVSADDDDERLPKELSREELAKKFMDKYKHAIGARGAQERKVQAFKSRVVRLIYDRKAPEVERAHAAEQALVSRFDLTDAMVVDTAETDDDTIHHQLGHTLSKALSSAPGYFRDNMVIGIGSGRAVHYFVDSFRHIQKMIAAADVTLMSLTGTIYPEAPNQGQLYDADINTVEFARFFGRATTVRTISFPIAHEDIPSVRRNTWLHDLDDDRFRDPDEESSEREASLTKWEGNLFSKHVPDMSVVGVGVLGPHHRLWREMRASSQPSKSPTSTMLDPIRRDLRELIALSDEVSARASASKLLYFPCTDVCHRFVFIPPPPAVKLAPSEEMAFKELIASVNRRMLTVTKTQLSQSKNVILIAGGVEKRHAIKHLVRRNTPAGRSEDTPIVVRTLCTDIETARHLLNEDKRPARRGRAG